MKRFVISSLIGLVAVAAYAIPGGKTMSLKGYVLDSACAYTRSLDKPISAECAKSCAAKGSPLVILEEDGTVYLPIDEKTPAAGQNAKLLPFAGQKVVVSGKVYERGGGKAVVIESIKAAN
jgi:hypothetical protein